MKNKIITLVVGFAAFATNATVAMDDEATQKRSVSPRGGRILITSRPLPKLPDVPEESASGQSPSSDEQKDALGRQKSPRTNKPPLVRQSRSSSLARKETQLPPPSDASSTLTGSSTEKIEFEREKSFKESANTISPGREADLSYEEPVVSSKEKSEKSVKKAQRGHLTSSGSDQSSTPKSERPSSKRHSQRRQPKPESLTVPEESTELSNTTDKSTRRDSRSPVRRQKEEADPLKSSSGSLVPLLKHNNLLEKSENLNENQVVDEVHRNPLEDKNHLNALLKSSEGAKMVSEEQKTAAQKLSAIQEIVNQNQAKESPTTIKIFGKSAEIHKQIKNKDDSYFDYFSYPKTEAKNHDVSMLVEPSKTDVYNKDFRLGNEIFGIEADFENYQKSKVELSKFIERDKTCTEMWDPHKKRDRYVIFNEFTAKPYYTHWPKPNYHHEIPIKLEKKESDVLPEKK